MVVELAGHKFYMDKYLTNNLDTAKKVIKKDWDMVFIVDGYEGSGKSVLAQQIAWYCTDGNFNIDNIAFTPNQFQEAILKAPKYSAVVFDEAYSGLSARAAMSKINRVLVKMLAEVRQRNLFILIVMPTFFDLDRYVAIWRSRALFHVLVGKDWSRGKFAFFNQDKKKALYALGKKFYAYSKVQNNFWADFVNHYVVDMEEYKKKKLIATSENEEAEKLERNYKTISKELYVVMFNRLRELKYKQAEIAKIMDIASRTLYDWRKEYEKKNLINENNNKNIDLPFIDKFSNLKRKENANT